jgi:hypothetical protein
VNDEQHHRHQHAHHDLPTGGSAGGGQECVLCPVCVLLQALSTSRPAATRCSVTSGRELTRALTAVLEGHAERSERSQQRLQRIQVE